MFRRSLVFLAVVAAALSLAGLAAAAIVHIRVEGKTQTIYPWDSWKTPYTAEPPLWFHDILRPDGTPYDPKEVAYIKRVTGKARP